MDNSQQLDKENLVQIHRARDEWEGNIIVGYLRDNGVEATLQGPPSVAHFDAAEEMGGSSRADGIFVMQHEAEQARQLLHEFLTTATDEKVLEETAAHKLNVDKETIAQLRTAIREERQTFDFLGWLFVVFLGASALLWAIWPDWLKTSPPAPEFRWVMVILLALAAVFAGNWAGRHIR